MLISYFFSAIIIVTEILHLNFLGEFTRYMQKNAVGIKQLHFDIVDFSRIVCFVFKTGFLCDNGGFTRFQGG